MNSFIITTLEPLKKLKVEFKEELIPEILLKKEEELSSKKWFDYRGWTSSYSTYIFFLTYIQVYREFYGKEIDVEKASCAMPEFCDADGNIIDATKVFFWEARQCADRYCCRYDFFLRAAFRRSLEFGWRHFPSPEYLSSEEVVLDVGDNWNCWLGNSLELAQSDFYHARNYCGSPLQKSYHEYLLKQINYRGRKDAVISRVVYKEKHIPIDVAVKYFTKEELSSALNFFNF